MDAMLDTCQRLSAQRDLPALFKLTAAEASRLLGADQASVFLLDRAKNELWSIATLDSKEIRFDARLGIAGAVALSGETVLVNDTADDPRFYPGVDTRTKYRTRNLVAVPLRNAQGAIIGVCEALNKKDGKFRAEDLALLETLASHAGAALETAQLLEQLSRDRQSLLAENSVLWRDLEGRTATQQIIGNSLAIQLIIRRIEQICDTDVNVLINGESGTGKELIARAIHFGSSRARHPWVCLNCAALPENLVESELFGIERGVATGVEARTGKFEAAQGGTLFLDEIGDLSLTAQAKILRVIQERQLERVGGRKTIAVDVRLLAATNKDLEDEVKNRRFRADLYYRLNVIHIRTPALREIPQDVPLLANYFLNRYAREMKRPALKLSGEAARCLAAYSWPGNIRELENEIKRIVVCTRRSTVGPQDLSECVRASKGASVPITGSMKDAVTALEQRMIRDALEAHDHNQQRAARALGLSRQGLIKKMKRYGLK